MWSIQGLEFRIQGLDQGLIAKSLFGAAVSRSRSLSPTESKHYTYNKKGFVPHILEPVRFLKGLAALGTLNPKLPPELCV